MKDIYFYENTDVLINKLNIRDCKELEVAEADISYIKLLDIDRSTIHGKFDLLHLKSIHKYIFEDIYEWAGEFRCLNIEKSEDILYGLSVQYSDHNLIENEVNKVLNHIKSVEWSNLTRDKLVQQFSISTAKLWRIHPFREGNTRTVITFMTQLAESNKFNLDRELLRKHSEFLRKALVLASIDDYSEYKYLIKIIDNALEDHRFILEKKESNVEKTFIKRILVGEKE